MSWGERIKWLDNFSSGAGGGDFYNFWGAISYFNNDPVFSNSKWASYSDAGVLFAMLNGYRLSKGLSNSCGGAPETGMCNEASSLWQNYFEQRINQKQDAYSEWGAAEQSGVNYGVAIASSLREQASDYERVQIDTFVTYGNAYRSLVLNYGAVDAASPFGAFSQFLNPDKLQSATFVYYWSSYVVNGTALLVSPVLASP
jgi:hypothetical protein